MSATATPVLTALFSGSQAAFLAASELFDSGFTPDQIQPIFNATQPHPDARNSTRSAAVILHPHHRFDEARTILLQHGAELI